MDDFDHAFWCYSTSVTGRDCLVKSMCVLNVVVPRTTIGQALMARCGYQAPLRFLGDAGTD